jgi:hypothetical protein
MNSKDIETIQMICDKKVNSLLEGAMKLENHQSVKKPKEKKPSLK